MDETPVGPPIPTDATPEALVNQAIRLLHTAKFKLQPKPSVTPAQQFIHFIRTYGDNPLKNTLKALGFVLLTAIIVFIVLLASHREQEKEILRRESQSYVAQTEALDNVKSSLKNLLDFVQSQKDKLQQSEDIVNSLQAEQEKLKPVVETNRQVIDAILDLQAQKARVTCGKSAALVSEAVSSPP